MTYCTSVRVHAQRQYNTEGSCQSNGTVLKFLASQLDTTLPVA